MTNRITQKDLETLVSRINRITNSPQQPYVDGKPQAGCYHLYYAYGGVCLHRMSLTPGCSGVTTPLYSYCDTKKKLHDMLYAYIQGLEAGQAKK